MTKGPYLIKDDAPFPNQRLTFEILGLAVFLPMILYITWQIVRNIRLRILDHGKYSFLWFYMCIEAGFICRLLYCFSFSFSYGPKIFIFPTVIFGILCYFPSVFTTTASLFFLISMLSSLDEVYQTIRLRKFGKMKTLVMGFIVAFWVIVVSMYSALAFTDIVSGKPENVWTGYYFYTCAGCNIVACTILIMVTVFYVRELRKFSYTYNVKKTAIFMMLGGTILQLSLRVLQALLNGTKVMTALNEECNESGSIVFHLYTCTYFVLSDVVPAIGYVLFLKKEVQTQASADVAASSDSAGGFNSSVSASSNVAELLERLYKKKEEQRAKNPTMLESGYDSNNINA